MICLCLMHKTRLPVYNMKPIVLNCPGAAAERIKMLTFSGSGKEGCTFGRQGGKN